MSLIEVEYLWQASGWLNPGWIETDTQGIILKISGQKPEQSITENFSGALIPSFVNAHSHAFQYLFAGLAENHQARTSDFWGWRSLMYQALTTITPEKLQVIATTVFQQMIRRGYAHVVEFHYLHRAPDGSFYSHCRAMADALIQAALNVGIGMTLVPVYYNRSSFDRPLEDGQKRFYFADIAEYQTFVRELHHVHHQTPNIQIGSGLHSLRVANQEDVISLMNQPPVTGPIHLHIAEQVKEVSDCLKHWGKRPVEWLLDHIELQSHHHLVHATHLTNSECDRLSRGPATVVICPSTEANLGDGIFPFAKFWSAGGHWSIGSDSQIGLCPLEELRWLDYTTRLQNRQRFNYQGQIYGELGDHLCQSTWSAGNQAAGLPAPLAVGSPLNACMIDLEHPRLIGKDPENWLSSLIFAGDQSIISRLFQAGVVRHDSRLKSTEQANHSYQNLVREIQHIKQKG